MRRVIWAVLFASVAISFLAATSVSSDGSGGYLRGSGFSLSLSSYKAWFSYGPFSTGEIDRTGLFRTLSDPYFRKPDFVPVTTAYRKSGDKHSAVLFSYKPFSFGWTTSGREAVFASLSYKYAEGALIYAFKGEPGSSYQNTESSWDESETLYLALKGGWKFFLLSAIISYSPPIGFVPFVRAEVRLNDYSVAIIAGDIIDFYDDGEEYTWGISGSMGQDGFKAEISYVFGREPIYTNKYLVREAHSYMVLDLGKIKLRSEMSRKISKTGKTSGSDSFSILIGNLELGWDSDDYLSFKVRVGSAVIGYEEGEAYIKINLNLGNVKLRLTFSSAFEIGLSFPAF